MRFTFEVSIEVERDSGLFASRDELAEQIEEALRDADPGSLSGDNGGEYSTTEWEVVDVTPEHVLHRRKPRASEVVMTKLAEIAKKIESS